MVEKGMEVRRGIHPIDVATFGGLTLLFIAATVGAILTPQAWPWEKILVLALTDITAMTITLVYFIKKWIARPNFITKCGMAVWTNGIEEITRELIERANARFIAVMVEEMPGEVTEKALRDVLALTGVEWSKHRVSLIVGPWKLKDKAGIQHGYRLLVQWNGTIAESAYFHELLHLVNQFIRRPRLKDPKAIEQFDLDDIQHREADWWRLDGVLPENY